MKQFEVGKVYTDHSRTHYIRVLGRTNQQLKFAQVNLEGHEYNVDGARKKIEYNLTGEERIHLNIGIGGINFYASHEVDFGKLQKEYFEEKKEREAAHETRIKEAAIKLADVVRNSGLSYEQCEKIVDAFMEASSDAMNEAQKILFEEGLCGQE